MEQESIDRREEDPLTQPNEQLDREKKLAEIKSYDDSWWLRYLEEKTVFDAENIKSQKVWLIEELESLLEENKQLQQKLLDYEGCKGVEDYYRVLSELRETQAELSAKDNKLEEIEKIVGSIELNDQPKDIIYQISKILPIIRG
ncbi:hypothetical protein [Cohnella abietis]|uniref:Uncharacterized protein n=1 Tax=Cohnella abietis TaxID=2507935 RepID=A0A3T1D1R0_9BACL|nr:hypothetical protein [Cohnella abietis]BBI32026.1 hypothetical protein KCTCHS21_14250 [Cohnella abietis]